MPDALLAAAGETSWVWSALGLLAIPALVLLNGFFVAAEFALVAVRRTRVEELMSQGVRRASAVRAAIENLDRSIAATQLGITLASIGLGFVAEPTLARVIEPVFAFLPETWGPVAVHSVAVTVAFILITFLHVIFGELIPKTLALQTPDSTALWVAKPMLVFIKLTRPLIVLMNGTGNAFLRWLGYRPATSESMIHSVEELALLVEDTQEAGLLDEDQAEVVQNVFRLSEKQVRACMVPREKMATLEVGMPPEKVLEAVRAGAHTRMPVYDRENDAYVGIVNTKDLFYLFSLKGVVILEDAMYPSLYLKADETVANALRLFKKARRHMALVRDEDGKVVGLVTLEDILEEIIGDIEDEHDRPRPRLARRPRRALAPPQPPPAEGRKP
jgi:CBS domain containing-hemolysin-like protein